MEIQLLSQERINKRNIIPVILCAGKGTRLGKLTQKVPKPLIRLKSLNNNSILSYLIKNLINLQVNTIVLITGHLNEKIEAFVNSLINDNQKFQGKLTLIHSGNDYEKGPLYSLLSIIQNKKIFREGNIYVILPGDTIFERALLKEAFSLIYENIDIIQSKPCIFFQDMQASDLINSYKQNKKLIAKFISILDSEDVKKELMVKEIKKIDLISVPKVRCFKLVVPILILSYRFIKIFDKLSVSNPVGEIREILNIYLHKQNQTMFPFKLNSKSRFYDIDTSDDLSLFNQIKRKKKGGQ